MPSEVSCVRVLPFVACAFLFAGAVALAQAQRQYPYPPVRDQRGAVPQGPRVEPWNSPPLGDGPFLFDSYEQRGLRAVVVTKGLSASVEPGVSPGRRDPDHRAPGRLRIVRNGMLDPTPVAGTPAVVSRGTMAGLMDIALHPRFAQNKWIYISYHKPMGTAKASTAATRQSPATRFCARTWDGKALTDVKDIFVADDVDMEASRIAFGRDGMLYMGIGGPGTGPQDQHRPRAGHQRLAGKILRMKDDGSVPPDNPFVGQDRLQAVHLHDGPSRAARPDVNPYTGEIWETENGPNGGDELNVIKPGKNYGWPIVSYGRDYNGPRFPPVRRRVRRAGRVLGAVDRARRA